MNSTGWAHPSCLNSTTVHPSSARRLQSTFVPTHSSGPATTSHRTWSDGDVSTTFMSKPPGGNRNSMTPPSVASPVVSDVHQPARPSIVVSASYTFSGAVSATATRCRISTISLLLLVPLLDRLGEALDAAQAPVPRRADGVQLGQRTLELLVVDP